MARYLIVEFNTDKECEDFEVTASCGDVCLSDGVSSEFGGSVVPVDFKSITAYNSLNEINSLW